VVCVYGINVGAGVESPDRLPRVSVGGSNGLEGVFPGAMIVAHYGSGFDAPPRRARAPEPLRVCGRSARARAAMDRLRPARSCPPSITSPAWRPTAPGPTATTARRRISRHCARGWTASDRSAASWCSTSNPDARDFLSESAPLRESCSSSPMCTSRSIPNGAWARRGARHDHRLVGVDEINAATQYLADLVRCSNFPARSSCLHQFTRS
jgi:hypothetical protein